MTVNLNSFLNTTNPQAELLEGPIKKKVLIMKEP